MAGAYGRGAQSMNSMFIKPMLRKKYHRKSSSTDVLCDTIKLNDEEVIKSGHGENSDSNWWIPHRHTGIYYPKGHEKLLEDIPLGAGKDMAINWFSNKEDTAI
ncbi:hypothetical protein L1049_005198 [Liquidambar formosana]|uniref:Uncharacterized protein n=1 Tax=Liquidambar formosana TaxID=63359 RepID=A0AAP0RPH3_LIQFO